MTKQLTEQQKRLLQKLIIAAISFMLQLLTFVIIAAISFMLGFLPNSDLLQKIIDFINNLIIT